MRNLALRLERLEAKSNEEQFLTYSVRSGEDAEEKRRQAWQRYHDAGGWQSLDAASYVRINKFCKV